jgi:nucleoid-associated protein YgaU
VRRGLDVAIRRRRRRARQVRRRRLALGVAVVALVTGLAVPWSATGGRALARPIARYGPSVASATVYVVQPGDTLWSIATKFDRVGDPRSLARAIARETGSDTVVPGERIAVP